jgi:hypothetical protein
MLLETILVEINDEDNREIYTAFIDILLNQYHDADAKACTADACTCCTTDACTCCTTDACTADACTFMPLLKDQVVFGYADAETMAFQLTLQLQLLEARGFSLLFWQPSDILVVYLPSGQKLYLLVGLGQLVGLNKKNTQEMVIIYPPIFPLPADKCAPEVLQMHILPFYTHRSASYYSLALLCLKQLNLSLPDIQDTKLFYFLERCMQGLPEERSLIYL